MGSKTGIAYAVGFKLKESAPGRADMTVRIDDVRRNFWAVYDLLDGSSFFEAVWREAADAVHVWGDAHPEYKPSRQQAEALMKQVAEPAWQEAAMLLAAEDAVKAKFRIGVLRDVEYVARRR